MREQGNETVNTKAVIDWFYVSKTTITNPATENIFGNTFLFLTFTKKKKFNFLLV